MAVFDGLVSEQPSQQFQCRFSVPFTLHHQVQDLALIVNGPPEIHSFAANPADHLIEAPARRRRRPATLQAARNLGAELDRPAADRLVADLDPALGQHLLNVAKAERELEIQLHRMQDDVGRKPMALERNRLHQTKLHEAFRRLQVETF